MIADKELHRLSVHQGIIKIQFCDSFRVLAEQTGLTQESTGLMMGIPLFFHGWILFFFFLFDCIPPIHLCIGGIYFLRCSW